jgi:hypothetical protein
MSKHKSVSHSSAQQPSREALSLFELSHHLHVVTTTECAQPKGMHVDMQYIAMLSMGMRLRMAL